MTVAHLTDAQLSDFLLGKLLDPEHAAVEMHLCNCEACVAKAARVVPVDTLAELLTAANARNDREGSAAVTPAPQHTPSALALTGEFQPPPTRAEEGPAPPPALADHPRYRLLRPLGAGGMGRVWLARHLVLDRTVAIKLIRSELLASAGAVERFRREARAVARLSHPNIVAAFDAEEAVGTHFLVMEHVAGE